MLSVSQCVVSNTAMFSMTLGPWSERDWSLAKRAVVLVKLCSWGWLSHLLKILKFVKVYKF